MIIATTTTIIFSSPQLSQLNVSLQDIVDVLKHQSFFNTPLFAAIIGLVGGLLPFFYLLYKERPIIKISVNPGYLIDTSGSLPTVMTVKIKNFGGRPTNICDFFMQFDNGDSVIFPTDNGFVYGKGLPKIIDEKNSHSVVIYVNYLMVELNRYEKYPKFVCFSDALGKNYSHKISNKFWNNLLRPSVKK